MVIVSVSFVIATPSEDPSKYIFYDDFNRSDSGNNTIGGLWNITGMPIMTNITNKQLWFIGDGGTGDIITANLGTHTQYITIKVNSSVSNTDRYFQWYYNSATGCCTGIQGYYFGDVTQGYYTTVQNTIGTYTTNNFETHYFQIDTTNFKFNWTKVNTSGSFLVKTAGTYRTNVAVTKISYVAQNTLTKLEVVSAWNGTVTDEPQEITATPDNSTLTRILSPANNTHFNTASLSVYYNTSINSANCSGYYDNIYYASETYDNSGNDSFIFSSVVFDAPSNYKRNITMTCKNTTNSNTSLQYLYVYDATLPSITDNKNMQGTNRAENQTTLNITIGPDYLYKVHINISCSNGTKFFSEEKNFDGSYQSYNINNISYNSYCGTRDNITIFIQAADTHTAKFWKTDKLVAQDKEINLGTKLKIYPDSKSEFNSVKTKELFDRVSYTFEGSKTQKEYRDFMIEGDLDYIYRGKYLSYGHFVRWEGFGLDNNWVDFKTKQNYQVSLIDVTKEGYKVRVYCDKNCDVLEFESLGGLNENNLSISFYYDYFNFTYQEQFDSYINENEITRLYFNTTFNTLRYPALNWVKLEWNNTNYTPSFIASYQDVYRNTSSYYSDITVPQGTGINGTAISHRWYYNLTSLINVTGTQTQNIQEYIFDNCTIGVFEGMKFNIYNESSFSSLVTANMDITVEYLTPTGIFKNFSYSLKNQNNFTFCIDPITASYDVNISLQFYKGTSLRDWAKSYQTITNNTQIYNLYLLDPGIGSDVTAHVINEDDEDLQGITVEAWLDDLGTGTQYLISSLVTNSDGEVKFNLDLTKWYIFRVYQDGELEIVSTSAKITTTTLEYVILGASNSKYTKMINIRGITAAIDYNNVTKKITFTYDDADNVSEIYYLTVLYSNNSVVYQTSSLNKSDTLNYTLIIMNESYYAYGWTRDYDDDNYKLADVGIDTNAFWQNFGQEGLIIVFLIYITISLLGLQWPELALGTGTVALFIIYWLGIIPISTNVLVWGLCMIVISMVALVKNR